MTDGGLQRTQYRNVATGTVRTGATGHGESLADVESYLLPLERARNTALLDAGVARGLIVQGIAGSPGLTVQTGVAVDALGRLVVLAAGGTVIVDPDVDPAQVQHVPTVLVPDAGLVLPTAGLEGERLLTVTWREVQADDAVATAVLVHAPWLRLIPSAGFVDSGDQVVLAMVSLAQGGMVTALSSGPRRRTHIVAGGLRIESPQPVPGAAVGGLGAGQLESAQVTGLEGGGLAVTVPAAGASVMAVRVEGDTAQVHVPNLHSTELGADRVTASAIATDTIAGGQVSASGLTVGLPPGNTPNRIVHAEGSEIHSGGDAGGFSFSDRATGEFVDQPFFSGQRWVWYALDGSARLWSQRDILTVDFVPTGLFFFKQAVVTVNGSLKVTGTISKPGGGFTIDHPQDPEHRLLSHSFVESPDMATLYTGTAVTGSDGTVEVVLPDYFGALNTDARVHLTAVDSLTAVMVASPVRDNRFSIRSAEPDTSVNWLIIGTRDDPWARAHRIQVETDKPEDEQGSYLHPEVIS
jgi:hypothetical protein